jgi:hypothetical protein
VQPIAADTVSSLSFAYGVAKMPRFFFDLFFDRYVVLDPGGMLLECRTNATATADELARHLLVSRVELRNSGGCIRVRDERRNEIYRSSIASDTPDGTA